MEFKVNHIGVLYGRCVDMVEGGGIHAGTLSSSSSQLISYYV